MKNSNFELTWHIISHHFNIKLFLSYLDFSFISYQCTCSSDFVQVINAPAAQIYQLSMHLQLRSSSSLLLLLLLILRGCLVPGSNMKVQGFWAKITKLLCLVGGLGEPNSRFSVSLSGNYYTFAYFSLPQKNFGSPGKCVELATASRGNLFIFLISRETALRGNFSLPRRIFSCCFLYRNLKLISPNPSLASTGKKRGKNPWALAIFSCRLPVDCAGEFLCIFHVSGPLR